LPEEMNDMKIRDDRVWYAHFVNFILCVCVLVWF
jgi:hypothetical protein